MAYQNKVLITGDVAESLAPVELHKCVIEADVKDSKQKLSSSKAIIDIDRVNFPRRYIDVSILKAASVHYNISSDIHDYIVVPVPVVTSEVPNRNGQAFTAKDLLEFLPELGMMRFQTFIHKPTHIDHKNEVLKAARGIILDAAVVPVKRYGVIKVNVLSAFDRTKDPDLARAIVRGDRDAYSMGAVASYFECSYCGGILGPTVKRTCTCDADYKDLRSINRIIGDKLLYHVAKDFVFIENSSVGSPADISAVSNIIF